MKDLQRHEYLQTVPRPVSAMAKTYPPGYTGYMHQHERAQFLYAIRGSMKLTFDRGCWMIPPQRAVWIPPRYPHQTGSVDVLEMRTLYIREDICPGEAPNSPRMIGVTSLLRELVLRIIEAPEEYDEKGQDGRVVTTALGEIDWTPLNPVSLPPLHDRRLKEMESRITQIPSDTSTLEDWATHLQMSSRSLTRLIQKETHLSFQAWRDRMRTFAALPMLAAGLPLAEIADALGYETAWGFTAMFKRVTGKVPSLYFSKGRTL